MTIIKKCSCGKEFEITDNEQEFYRENGLELPKRCHECRKIKKEDKNLTCVDCGKQFTITGAEALWYYKKGYSLPRRCSECRAKNNLKKKENK